MCDVTRRVGIWWSNRYVSFTWEYSSSGNEKRKKLSGVSKGKLKKTVYQNLTPFSLQATPRANRSLALATWYRARTRWWSPTARDASWSTPPTPTMGSTLSCTRRPWAPWRPPSLPLISTNLTKIGVTRAFCPVSLVTLLGLCTVDPLIIQKRGGGGGKAVIYKFYKQRERYVGWRSWKL